MKVFRIEKGMGIMSSGRVMIIRLIAGLIKKILIYKTSYYPGPESNSRN